MAKNKANRVKEWMAKRSMNQAEVAKKLGISTSYLSLISNGKRNPNLRLSTKLANLLDVELLDLFPQNSSESGEVLDFIMVCQQASEAHEAILKGLREKGHHGKMVHGEFDLGYMTFIHRPKVLLIFPDMVSLSLENLNQRLKMEPLTAHINAIPLISAVGELAARRKQQIKKIGLEGLEWDPQNPTNLVESLSSVLKGSGRN